MAFVFFREKNPSLWGKMQKEGTRHKLSLPDTEYIPLKEYLSFYSQSFLGGSVIGFSCFRQREGTNNGGHVWGTRVLMFDLGLEITSSNMLDQPFCSED